MAKNPEQLAYPSSATVFAAFLERIGRSPTATVDVDWLGRNLQIKSASNARVTLHWFRQAGIVSADGTLDPRGRSLLAGPETDTYRLAAREAFEAVAGDDLTQTIRARQLSPDRMVGHLKSAYKMGESAAQKARVGLQVLADAADDADLTAGVGTVKSRSPRAGQSPTAKLKPTVAVKPAGGRTATPQTATSADAQDGERSNPPPESPGGQQAQASSVLHAGLIQITIDSGWRIDDIQRLLRMLQLVERGALLPEPEGSVGEH